MFKLIWITNPRSVYKVVYKLHSNPNKFNQLNKINLINKNKKDLKKTDLKNQRPIESMSVINSIISRYIYNKGYSKINFNYHIIA